MKDKKLKRLLKLADINPVTENKKTLSSIETVKRGGNGKVYAVIRENRKYYIKETEKTENLTESDFDYIGGVQNKGKNVFNSFSEATKRLNFMFEQMNHNSNSNNINLLESDEDLLSEKKYVLKTKKKSEPKPEPELDLDMDFGGGKEGADIDFGGDDIDFGDEEGGDMDFGDEEGGDMDFGDEEGGDMDFGDEESEDIDLEDDEDLDDEEDPIKVIQKTTGKLGQKLRDTEDVSSDMQKWVAKSVLAALDLEDMESSDKKDLIKTIKKAKPEEDEDEEFGSGENFGDEDVDFEESYDNYMSDDEDPNLLTKADLGGGSEYDSYMGEDDYEEDLDTSRGGERYDRDELLFDDYMDEDSEPEFETIEQELGLPPATNEKDETEYDKTPGFGGGFNESFNPKEVIKEDHFNDRMNTHEQLQAYLDVEKMAHQFGMEIGWCHEEEEADIEEMTVYLDLKDGGEVISKIRINSVGDIEMGRMEGKNFIGEPVDTLTDFDEVLREKQIEENDMEDFKMDDSPAPAKPTTKPDTDTPPARPSRRPFTPPPHIRPGEEPGPKAKGDEYTEETE